MNSYKVITESGKLNIRKEPSTSSAKVGSLASGTIIEGEAVNEKWVRTAEGYVSLQYLSLISSNESSNDEEGDMVTISLSRNVFNVLRCAFNEVGGD